MRSTYILVVSLANFLTSVRALTITGPAGGSIVDPGKDITVTWTSTSSDPSTFDLSLNTGTTSSLFNGQTLAKGVSTPAGSYLIPAGILATYGTQFEIVATDTAGKTLASSASFTLAQGVYSLSTGTNGATDLVTLPTAPASTLSTFTSPTSLESLTFSTDGVTGSVTAFTTHLPVPTSAINGTSQATTSTGSESSVVLSGTRTATTSSSSASRTTGQASSATSQAAATSSTNAQARIGGSNEMVLSVAGVLAGLVALVA